jgi:hypothetical protein
MMLWPTIVAFTALSRLCHAEGPPKQIPFVQQNLDKMSSSGSELIFKYAWSGDDRMNDTQPASQA